MKDQILDILDSATASGAGDFCTSGQLSDVAIKLDVKKLGTVRVPVAPRRARQLIEHCTLAPYGLGSKTIVDTSVRNVWELGPRKFKIVSPDWNSRLAELLKTVATALGLKGEKITARLYKLLVYEQGSFFLPHQDTEKPMGCLPRW